MTGHIDYAPIKDCKNINSYGLIRVKCNQCGRFDKEREDADEVK